MSGKTEVDVRLCHPVVKFDENLEITRSTRDLLPTHYTFKVESFSKLSQMFPKTQEAKYESETFESGDYKWRLSFYPDGRKQRNGNGHISLYLAIAETENFSLSWEVNVIFSLFVLDQIRGKYLTVQDASGSVKCFNAMKTEWGFAQFLPLTSLNDASNGYLVDDSCVFGAEVFVVKCSGKGECLSILEKPIKRNYTWKVDFFKLQHDVYFSEEFIVGGHQWKLKLCPNAVSEEDGKQCVGLYLIICDNDNLLAQGKLYAKFTLRIMDGYHRTRGEITDYVWFSTSIKGYGYPRFVLRSDLSTGLAFGDLLIVGDIEIISEVKNFTGKN